MTRIPDFTGVHYFERLLWARANLVPVESDLRCVYEDPAFPDAPPRCLRADPRWFAAAMAGGIIPPLEAVFDLQKDLVLADGRVVRCTYFEAQDVHARERVIAERCLSDHALHSSVPVGAMTEDQAFEYLIQKDVPFRVWGRSHNRPIMKICRADQLPKSRAVRGAWSLAA